MDKTPYYPPPFFRKNQIYSPFKAYLHFTSRKIFFELRITEYISLYDIDNTTMIITLVLLLILFVIFIGKLKSFFSLLALISTILLVFFVLIPLTLKGYPPLILAIVISIISTVITLPIIAGFQKKDSCCNFRRFFWNNYCISACLYCGKYHASVRICYQ